MRVIPLAIRNLKEAGLFMNALGVDPAGLEIMAPKTIFKAFKVRGISSYAANIVKQHLLSLGSDAALSRSCLVKRIKTDIIIFGTAAQLEKLREKIKHQPFGLKELSVRLADLSGDKKMPPSFFARGRRVRLDKYMICGIINVTPDSFSGDGLLAGDHRSVVERSVKASETMISQGAGMLDIGGESTRPFSRPVTVKEELKRVLPVIRAVRRRFKKILISVDTYKYEVARAAADEGADIINDITALRHAPRTADLVREYKLGCILMHMKGSPSSMQRKPVYKGDVVEEIIEFLDSRISFCLERGIERTQLMVDPGIGFGKKKEHNCAIINRAHEFKALGVPLFMGLSKKSFIGDILNDREAERLSGTIAGSIISLIRGADVLRVHDVPEISRALRVVDTILN